VSLTCLIKKSKEEPLKHIMDYTSSSQTIFNEILELDLRKTPSSPFVFNKINPNTFEPFRMLNKLNLYGNQIASLDLNTFSSLINLKEMDLSENCLVRLDANIFQNLTCLTKLLLAKNQIVYIDVNAFNGLTNLEELCLDYNALCDIR